MGILKWICCSCLCFSRSLLRSRSEAKSPWSGHVCYSSGQFYCSMCNVGAGEERWRFRQHLEQSNMKTGVSVSTIQEQWMENQNTYSDCHIQIEQLVCVIATSVQHACFVVLWYRYIPLLNVNTRNLQWYHKVSELGRKRICLSLDAFQGQLCWAA